jgi:hypothetical protein
MGLEPTGLFDTHPSNGDRIRLARQMGEPGVFHVEAPAACLFSNFEVVAKQVTLLHYADDLGLPLPMARLFPVKAVAPPAQDTEPTVEQEPIRPSPGGLRLRGFNH